MLKNNRFLSLCVLSILTTVGLFLWIGSDNKPVHNPSISEAADKITSLDDDGLHSSSSPGIPGATPTFYLSKSPAPTFTPTRTGTPTLTPTPRGGEILTIGYSVEGRPLEVSRFGHGKHDLLLIAGVHGGYEWNTVALADQLIEYLKNNPEMIPEDTTLHILKVFNPDGYHRDHCADGRANANNVDLNRNWDANWQAKWSGTQCWSKRVITAGSEPFSEPETQALKKFIQVHRVQRIINYHSAGLGIFAGGLNDGNSKDLARKLAAVSPYSYPPIATDCQFTGQLIDWASSQGIAAVDVELSNHTDTDFEINLEILRVFLSWKPGE